MKINYKIPLLFISLIIITSAIINANFYYSHVMQLNNAKQEHMSNIVGLIEYDLIQQSNRAAARAALVSDLPSVAEAFRHHDRQKLLKELLPAFNKQRNRYDVADAQFHLPPAISFLRLYDTKINSKEDISSFRSMVLAVNHKHFSIQGIEIGRGGLSIRSISEVKDNQGAIGSFEVGLDFSPILKDVKYLTGSDMGIFVDNELMRNVATLSTPTSNKIIGKYQLINTTNEALISDIIDAESLRAINDITYTFVTINNIDYGIALFPLIDYSGSEIGVISSVANFESSQHQLHNILMQSIVYTALQAILLIGGLLILINGLLIKPFQFLNIKLAELADGNSDIDIGKYENLHDEIGLMAKSIVKIKKILKKEQQA